MKIEQIKEFVRSNLFDYEVIILKDNEHEEVNQIFAKTKRNFSSTSSSISIYLRKLDKNEILDYTNGNEKAGVIFGFTNDKYETYLMIYVTVFGKRLIKYGVHFVLFSDFRKKPISYFIYSVDHENKYEYFLIKNIIFADVSLSDSFYEEISEVMKNIFKFL